MNTFKYEAVIQRCNFKGEIYPDSESIRLKLSAYKIMSAKRGKIPPTLDDFYKTYQIYRESVPANNLIPRAIATDAGLLIAATYYGRHVAMQLGAVTDIFDLLPQMVGQVQNKNPNSLIHNVEVIKRVSPDGTRILTRNGNRYQIADDGLWRDVVDDSVFIIYGTKNKST